MYTWLSRGLLLVFTFQVVAPQLAQAQMRYPVPTPTYSTQTGVPSTESLEAMIRAATEHAGGQSFAQAKTLAQLDDLYNQQRKELIDLYDTIEVNVSMENGMESMGQNMSNYSALYDVVLALHKLSDEYYPHVKKFQAKARQEQARRDMLTIDLHPTPTIVNDATYVAPSASGQLLPPGQQISLAICSFVSEATTVEDLVEILDPFQEIKGEYPEGQNYGSCTTYAAEALSHYIDGFLAQSSLSQDDTDFWTDFLPRLTARMQHSYYGLPATTSSGNLVSILNRGTFRVLLYKVHQLYKKLGFQDPLTWQRIEKEVPSYKIRPNALAYQAYVNTYNQNKRKLEKEHEEKIKQFKQTHPWAEPADLPKLILPKKLSLPEFQKQGEQIVQDSGTTFGTGATSIPAGYEYVETVGTETQITQHDDDFNFFHNILRDFESEFRAIKNNKETKPGTALYTSLRTQVEAMLTYSTIIGEPSTLEMVATTLDEREKVDELTKAVTPSPLLVENSDLIQTAFNTVISALRNIPSNDTFAIKVSKDKIVTLTEPQYGTATRIAAIGAVGLLNKATKWEEEGVANNPTTNTELAFDEETRQKVASYAADFYKDLNPKLNYYENFSQDDLFAMQGKTVSRNPTIKGAMDANSDMARMNNKYPTRSYGLDSKQMVILQDQLVTDIHNLLPIQAPKRVWNAAESRYRANPHATWTLEKIPDNTGKTIWDPFHPSVNPPSGGYAIPTYVYDSKHKIVTLYMHNPINRYKRGEEILMHGLSILGEAVLWVVGGEVFSLGIRFLHMVRGMAVMLPAAYRSSRTVARSMRLAGKSNQRILRAQIGRFSSKMRQGRQYAISLSSRGQNIGITVAGTTRTENVAAKGVEKAVEKAAKKQKKIQKQIETLAADPKNAKKIARLEEKAAQLEQDIQRMTSQAENAAAALEKSADQLSKQARNARRKAGKRNGKTGERFRQQADDLEQQAAALREQAANIRSGTGSYTADVTRAGYKYSSPRARSSQRGTDGWLKRMRNRHRGQTPQNVGWNVSQHRLGYNLRDIYIDAAKYRLEYANPGSWHNVLDNALFWRAFSREGGELSALGKQSLVRVAKDGSISFLGKQLVDKDGFVGFFGKQFSFLGKPIQVSISPREEVLEWFIFNPFAEFKFAHEASILEAVGRGIRNMDGSVAFFTSKGEPATFEQLWATMREAPANLTKNRQEFLRLLEINPGATAAEVEQTLNAFKAKWEAWQAAYEQAATRLAGGKIPAGKREEYYNLIDEMILSNNAPAEFQAFENPLTDFQKFQAVFKSYETTAPEFFYAVPRANLPGGKIPTKFDPASTPGVTRIVQHVETTSSSTLIGAEATPVEMISTDPATEIKQMFKFFRQNSKYSGLNGWNVFHNYWIPATIRQNFIMFSALDLTTDRWLYNLMEKQTDYRSEKQYKKAQEENNRGLNAMQDQMGYEEGEDDASNLFNRLYNGRDRMNERLFTTYSFMWPVPSQNPIPDLLWKDLLTDEDRANIQVESVRTTQEYLITLRDWNQKVKTSTDMFAAKREYYARERAADIEGLYTQALDAMEAELAKAERAFHAFADNASVTLANKNALFDAWSLADLAKAEDAFYAQVFAQQVADARAEMDEELPYYQGLLEDDTDGIYTELLNNILSELEKRQKKLDSIVTGEGTADEKLNQLSQWRKAPVLRQAVRALEEKQWQENSESLLSDLAGQRLDAQETLTGQALADKLEDINQTEQALREIMQQSVPAQQKYTAWNKWQVKHFEQKAETQRQRLEERNDQLKRELDRAILRQNIQEAVRLKKVFNYQEQYATLLHNILVSSATVTYKNAWLKWWQDSFEAGQDPSTLQKELSFVNADETTRQQWLAPRMSNIQTVVLYLPVEKYAFWRSQLDEVEGNSEETCGNVLLYETMTRMAMLGFDSMDYPELSDEDKDFWTKHQADSLLLQMTEDPVSYGKKIESFGPDAIEQRDELWRQAQEELDNIFADTKLTVEQKRVKYNAVRATLESDLQTLWNGFMTSSQHEEEELYPDENSVISPIIH